MSDAFQRLFQRQEFVVESLSVQAARGPVRPPHRSQFSLLLRHFVERFFNHETASPDGDAKTRMVQIACAAGLPPLLVAVYLWPTYHPFPHWPPGQTSIGPPPYWLQVNHHLFFVIYAFVAMGIATVWEWDLFFPDLLDQMVLGPLPTPARRVFAARVAAIAVLVFGFLVDTNALAPLVLVLATDPPNALRFLVGDLLAVITSALFAAALVLAVQAVLVATLGERLFRRLSLAVQGGAVAVLVVLVLLFPMLSQVAPALLQSGSAYALWFPPFWFLGIGQSVIDGPSALPIWSHLARIGWRALLVSWSLAVLAYPVAYLRRVRQIVEGSAARSIPHLMLKPLQAMFHATLLRSPVRRAVFHFISQTILRVPRYRINLALYGGVGLSVVLASIVRFKTGAGSLDLQFSADGIRIAIGIVAFWLIAGLRSAFVASGNQRGSWMLKVIHGKPPALLPALELLCAAQVWTVLCSVAATLAAVALLQTIAPPGLRTAPAIAAQVLLACGLSLLLTDAFFLNVTTVAFTGEAPREQSTLAFTVLLYVTFFPVVTGASLVAEHWIEIGARQFGMAALFIVVAHLWLRKKHRQFVQLHCGQAELEEGEDDFPLKLGLRY
jgi:hypothetical protein